MRPTRNGRAYETSGEKMTRYTGWENLKPKPNKYGAQRVQVDGIFFDSKKEAARFNELKLMQTAGLISKLETHPVYGIFYNGETICQVELDFKYWDVRRAEYIHEDVKTTASDTALSKLKRKLARAFHGIEVELVGI